jgi:NhaA family Na+:H+ antiporter
MLGEIKLAVLPVLAALGGVLRFRHHAAFRAANAGVNLGAVNLQANATLLLLAGVAAGRVIGKPLRILLATVLTVRLGWCACLAFEDDGQLAAAKLAVLIGSTLAAIIGLVVGRRWLRDSSQPARGA